MFFSAFPLIGPSLTGRYTKAVTSDPANLLDNILGASTILTNLSSFLLSFFVTTVMDRWWQQCQLNQELLSAARMIAMLSSTYLVGRQGAETRDRLARYAWLVNTLSLMCCRKDSDLRILAQYGGDGAYALLPEEETLLRNEAPAMRVWLVTQWMSSLLLGAVANRSLFTPGTSLRLMQLQIERLNTTNTKIQLLIDRQLSFPYIHLLTVVVKVTILFLSAEYGYKIGVLLDEDNPYLLIVIDLAGIILINFFYQGLLNLCSILSRPYFEHPAHLPRKTMMRGLRRDMETIINGRSRMPFPPALDASLEEARGRLTQSGCTGEL